MAIQRFGKNFKKCCTCRYWQGAIRVVSMSNIECDSNARAICNKTGMEKRCWSSCNMHEKRLDF